MSEVTVIVTASYGLNIREKPTTKSKILRTALNGESLVLKGFSSRVWAEGLEWKELNEGGWTAIKYTKEMKKPDYVHNRINPKPPVLSGFADNIYDSDIYIKDLNPVCFNRYQDDILLKQYQVLNFLDIEALEHKLAPRGGKTFCNIYAYQHLRAITSHLKEENKPYFPRFWYNAEALSFLEKGFEVSVNLPNLWEVSANDAHNWLITYGKFYGWQVDSYTDSTDNNFMKNTQEFVNNGGIAYIVARRKKTISYKNGVRSESRRSGHVTVVIPETGKYKYEDATGVVQSQAGTTNKKIFVAKTYSDIWYNSTQFDSVIVIKFKP